MAENVNNKLMKSGLNTQLDNLKFIENLDSFNCLNSIKYLPHQLEKTWADALKDFSSLNYKDIDSLYFCGMGGSAYPARIIKYLFRLSLPVTLEIVDNYNLPASVSKNSLVICCSYSGNTKETISCCRQALTKNLQVIGISSGGLLFDLLKANNKPCYKFSTDLNPSNQPRLGQGYLLAASLALLSSLNFIKFRTPDMDNLCRQLHKNNVSLDASSVSQSNQAKKIAIAVSCKIPNLVAGDFLEGVIHAVRNPLNETGKHFANYFILPELNHHLLEGLQFPSSMTKSALFVFISSRFYPDKIKKRLDLTRKVVIKNKIPCLEIKLNGKNEIGDALELIQLCTFVSFYLAVIHNVNPQPVPWVDYFKEKLK